MEHSDYIAAIGRDGRRLASVTPADIDVPTCPGWTLIDLVHHLGSVHRWQIAQLDTDDTSTLQPAPPFEIPTDPADLPGWLTDGVDELTRRLTEVGPDHGVPTWFGPGTALFWARRAAHETAIHRWDGQAAVTTPEPIDTELAIDAVDELLEIVVPRRLAANPWEQPAVTIHMHATDDGLRDGLGEWMLALDGSTIEVAHEHGKGDVAIRAGASDLVLVIAGRLPHARTEVFGDAAILDRWHSTVNI